jgi:hypothetical protein
MYIGLHVTINLVRFQLNLNFLDRFLKNQISRKSVQWEPSCSMQIDRQTDMMKLIVALCKFVNTPKRGSLFFTFQNCLFMFA